MCCNSEDCLCGGNHESRCKYTKKNNYMALYQLAYKDDSDGNGSQISNDE